MGGNALKNVETQRLPLDVFQRVATSVVQGLQATFPTARVDVIPAYRQKSDFGDLDVMVSRDGLEAGGGHEVLMRLIQERFLSREQFLNDNILSFDHRDSVAQEVGFQVDVITTPDRHYDFALNYFSFNDLGNLIGRTAHKAGFSFGHDGLSYPMRDGDYLFTRLMLTQNFDDALNFLGYDPKRFREGFDGLEDVFNYVASSRFFNRDIFLLQNRSYKDRIRDRKRKTYTEFLDWCAHRSDLTAFQFPEDRSMWLVPASITFPAFGVALSEARAALERQRRIKEHFNGEVVSGWTGLDGKGLGVVMKHVREGFESREAFTAYLDTVSDADLKAKVLSVAETFKDAVQQVSNDVQYRRPPKRT